MNNGQTIYKTAIECPECNHKEAGLASDGKQYWCNQCDYGNGEDKVYGPDLPDIPNQIDSSEGELPIGGRAD